MIKYIIKKSRLKRLLVYLSVLTAVVFTGFQVSLQNGNAASLSDSFEYVSSNGIETKKTVRDNQDGSYTITLESYTTGMVTQETTTIPVDFVLVLDQSGSMSSNNLGSVTRQQAMINAINGVKESTNEIKGFLDIVSEKSSEKVDNRVSIVTFSTNAAVALPWTFVKGNENIIKNTVSSFSANGFTNAAGGMSEASDLLNNLNYNGDKTKRQKVVIFLSDGISRTGSQQFDPSNANSAVSMAKALKDSGVIIYTIGIFEEANPDLTYPLKDGDNKAINENSTTWKGISNTTEIRSIKPLESGIGNRFCNYLSSNYPSAQSLGLSYTVTGNFYSRKTVKVTVDTQNTNYTRNSSKYFLKADNSEALAGIFQTITEQVSSPEIDLGTDTIIQDTVTPYFTIPDNLPDSGNIKIYTSEATSSTFTDNTSWQQRIEDFSLSTVTDGNKLRVTGFDYNENFISENPKSNGSYGKKLIVEFTVIPSENFLGGTVETNITKDSGIVIKDDDGNESFIENFISEPDTVSVPLKSIEPDSAEWNVYITAENELAEKFSDLNFFVNGKNISFQTLFDGTNNAGVDVSFVLRDSSQNAVNTFTVFNGETAGNWNFDIETLSDSRYTIECKINDAGGILEPKTAVSSIKLNVFKPVLTFTDMNVYYGGEQVDLETIMPVVEWKCGGISDFSVTMNTEKPKLTYKYSGITGSKVNQKEDYTVKVMEISADGQEINLLDIDNAVKFLRKCSTENLNGEISSANAVFKVHVITLSLSIKKQVEGKFANKTEKFSFEVIITPDDDTGIEKIIEKFSLADNDTKVLEGLPKANFEISEIDIPNGYKVYFEINSGGKELKNDHKIDGILSSYENSDKTIVTVTNELETVPVTGINDGNPLVGYGIILFAGIGIIFWHIFAKLKNKYT